ncbi:prealbumin-like fold domain-containing protein [Litorihabitans aurantiacus]|uniref:SpaA-like prealbumin fold domain-containing protein n=1 Tax=Litorihabitans aurantiacus TaxID=1930061 RepID=A0AA37XHG7_9MICO|nr:prealbumin-like fold domain-containing protein [Litorihabitans aurantiacus]GMA33303.1 hypothetical protein GCM10025875_32950 [Litorihabitans aurantiacus]
MDPHDPGVHAPPGEAATLRFDVEVVDDAWFGRVRNVAGVRGDLAPTACPVVTGPLPPVDVVDPACQTVHPVTGLVELQKTGLDGDGTSVPMAGSTFAIHTVLDTADGPALGPVDASVVPVAVEGVTGRFRVPGIAVGTHYLVETAAPEGYSLLAQPVLLRVGADRSVTLDPGAGPTVTVTNPAAGAATGFSLVTVRDVPRFTIPEAGGTGDAAPRALGLALVATSLALLGLLTLRHRAGPRTTSTTTAPIPAGEIPCP